MSHQTYANVILTLILLILLWSAWHTSVQLSSIRKQVVHVEANTGVTQKLLAK